MAVNLDDNLVWCEYRTVKLMAEIGSEGNRPRAALDSIHTLAKPLHTRWEWEITPWVIYTYQMAMIRAQEEAAFQWL